MKLALFVCYSPDRRSAKVLGDPAPADQVIKRIKETITKGVAPDPLYPIIAAVGLTNVLREHAFRPTLEQLAAANEAAEAIPSEDELNALFAANEAMQAQLETATKRILELEVQLTAAANEAAEAIPSEDELNAEAATKRILEREANKLEAATATKPPKK